MPTFTYVTDEWAAKLDAWVLAIRNLARIHKVAHRVYINDAVKEVRKPVTLNWTPMKRVDESFRMAVTGGIPEEELLAVRTLIFG